MKRSASLPVPRKIPGTLEKIPAAELDRRARHSEISTNAPIAIGTRFVPFSTGLVRAERGGIKVGDAVAVSHRHRSGYARRWARSCLAHRSSSAWTAVREAFAENFARRGELGGACCAYVHGAKVVDLWGGIRNPATREPWQQDTMVIVYSATKGLAAMTLAIAHSRGWLDYEERVCVYWPEFAQHGKERITVRQLLAHQAGLFALDNSGVPVWWPAFCVAYDLGAAASLAWLVKRGLTTNDARR